MRVMKLVGRSELLLLLVLSNVRWRGGGRVGVAKLENLDALL